MAGHAGNWVKLRKGRFKGTTLYLSKAQRERLDANYGGINQQTIIMAMESDRPSIISDAIEAMADKERPKGAAKPAVSFAAKVDAYLNADAADQLLADESEQDMVDWLAAEDKRQAAAKPAPTLERRVKSSLIDDWGRVSTMLLGGSREGDAPTRGYDDDAKITISPNGRVQLTTYTSSAQMYITYNATVDESGKITALQYAYAEPRDYALGDTEDYAPMTESQVRAWMNKYA